MHSFEIKRIYTYMNLLYLVLLHLQIAALKLQIAANSHDTALIAQANTEAVQAIQDAETALQSSIITPTDPILSPVQPPAPNPAPTPIPSPIPAPENQTLTAVSPTQISWDGTNGMVANLQFGYGSQTIFHLDSHNKLWDSGTLTINRQTYNLPIMNMGQNTYSDIYFGVDGLASGQTYPYGIQINSGNNFATYSDSVSIP